MDISLRQWKVSDAPNLAAGLSNLKILNNLRDGLPYPYTEKDALAFISEVSSKPDKIYAFAVESDGVLAGSVGVYRKDNIHFRSAEIGYYLFENFWGKGIATKAVKMSCDKIFSETDIIRIFAEPFAYNERSCRVLEKAGFVFEGILKKNAVKCGKTVDMKMYALLK